ncbi:MAG: hypothetical protein ACI8WB_003297 [Phenylobacterium sp.]|jgi:hypothetical protein
MVYKVFGALMLVLLGAVLGVFLGPNLGGSQVTPPVQDPVSWYQVDELFVETREAAQQPGQTEPASSSIVNKTLDIKATAARLVAMDTQFKQFASAYPVAVRASEPQLRQLIETLLNMEANPDSIGIARIFYVSYINRNPLAAVTHFWDTVDPESTQHRRVMFNIYHEWAWMDMPATLDHIVNVAPEKTREDIIRFLVSDDHFTTNNDLLTLAQDYSQRTRTALLLSASGRESFGQAFERFVSMEGDVQVRRQGLYSVVRRWAAQDPAGALQRVQQMSGSSQKTSLINSVIGIWAKTDVEQALNVALNLSEPGDHALRVLGTLARTQGIKALEMANLYRDKLDTSATSHIMQSWAMEDPRGAAAYLEEKGDKRLLKDSKQIVWHYTTAHPEEAYQWAERMGLLNDSNVASNMGNALVQADLAKAEQLFSTMPANAFRTGLFGHIVRQRSKQDIGQTYNWLMENKAEGGYDNALNNLMYEWTRRDPEKAAEMVLAMDENPNKLNHIYAAANNWYDKSPDSALNWVYSLPRGALRDGAIANLAQKVARFDANEAAYIAGEIDDELILERVMNQIRAKGQ